jgi:hypothetical protein
MGVVDEHVSHVGLLGQLVQPGTVQGWQMPAKFE